ncbi:MAG: hypothetical protein J6R44_03155, partial [Clostridia bacterium]|nr:hypothetical protein [Clostridia bacterium]
MISYYDFGTNARALLMSIIFASACLSLVVFVRLISRRRLLPKILLPVCTLINLTMSVLFASEARIVKFSREMIVVVDEFCKAPIFICIIILIACLGYTIFAFIMDLVERRKQLSKDSIKESLDKLPTGLCFSQKNGRIILSNYAMNELCHTIFGIDLQNATRYWEILSSEQEISGVERIESGEQPSLRLGDGKVWSFIRTELDDVVQIVAFDTTELSNVNAELKRHNAEIKAVNARLRKYGERVDALTRTRERVEIKANIHRELGQALLVTRRYLVDTEGGAETAVNLWKKNIAMLKREAEHKNDGTLLAEFLESAEASGVKVQIDGKFPTDDRCSRLFVTAAI